MALRPEANLSARKTQVYLMGAVAGLIFGVLSAHMYNRAATDYGPLADGENRIKTGEVIGLVLALIAVVRQIAEMGRGPEPKRGRRG